ncbi:MULTISPECIES: M48 family metallopeptidase [Streptacidiphilus]|uniref:M48 family metallopeptidase n=1 Tax=Streptacidiphilus cavernicola TaxID=3342716 RepID=A0ABV6UGT0_9ACTN|nr:M48 family metallopeptidase [Streptacidiphilus jeojiense]
MSSGPRTSSRAVRAAGLLVGFYAMGFGLLALLLAIDYLVLDAGDPSPRLVFYALGFSALAGVPILRGIFFTRGNRMRKPPGVRVTRFEQPVLWQRVEVLAQAMGTRPPKEIWITADVNAAVHEESWLLGLIPGKRRMLLGAPLLIGLTPAQFDAVVGHELGHYSNQDTRLAGLVQRGRDSMTNTLRAFHGGNNLSAALFALYKSYAERYLRTTQAISREQERAADLAAVRIAGRDNAASALRQIPALDAGFDFYLGHYAASASELGLLPHTDEFIGGFRHLLADPERIEELDAIRRDLPKRAASPYDSHPPMDERVAAIEALPEDGRGRDSGSATEFLHLPAPLFGAVARSAWKPENNGKQQVDWATLLHTAGRARALEQAGPLLSAAAVVSGGSPTLMQVLEVVDRGGLASLCDRLPEPKIAKGTTGRLRDEHLRTDLGKRLRSLVEVTVADAGRGGWPLSWSHSHRFELRTELLPEGFADRLQPAVEAVVAGRPSTSQLRLLVQQLS